MIKWSDNNVSLMAERMELYEIGKLIGTGSSGEVFLCKHKAEKNYNYALKRIKTFEIPEKQRENIENELKILQKMRHINIVSYKDSFTDRDGNLCIVMVYCQQGDMHNKIKQMKEKGKNFSESQILDWLTQTALAIYYLHNQKILHRDLKTQNLFLKRDRRPNDAEPDRKEERRDDRPPKDERIKLGDFGIAKVLDTTQDLARTRIGTPYYMAPEVFKYKPYSYKSDIWSLGIIVYELCNLRLPFEAQYYNALAMKILKGTYPSIMPTYSKQLRDLITSMLSKKPADRPNIIDILNKPFIRPRIQKYIGDLLSRSTALLDVQDIFLDTLKEQAALLDVFPPPQEEGIKKYPSSKDLEKKQFRSSKSYFNRRTEEEENELMSQYHSKRKSTFEKDSKMSDETNSTGAKTMGMSFDMSDEKDAFVNHKNQKWMEKVEKKAGGDNAKKMEEFKANKRFKIEEDYGMQDENIDDENEMQEISQDIRGQESDEDLRSTVQLQQQEQVPQSYNTSYYKLLDKIKVLKHRCETALGSNKYLRAYQAVNNGANKAAMLEILSDRMIGYWHLIDQIMFNESILRTLPKN